MVKENKPDTNDIARKQMFTYIAERQTFDRVVNTEGIDHKNKYVVRINTMSVRTISKCNVITFDTRTKNTCTL